jgi:hypothetical protein
MLNWLRRRRLSAEARKKLLLLAARSEEALVETHVSNLMDMLETLGDEVEPNRAIELYTEMMSLDAARETTVTNRLLARLQGPAAGRGGRRFRNVFRSERAR